MLFNFSEKNLADIIQLLPDNIANQIAAGEVIQRPASAVKELLENAVDAGATEIKLIIGDAGKSLIQVIDNGKGMSETDARLSFERHATSKIRNIDDLFHIRTMGFRGEALASIAAVAQVELKTKRDDDTAGSFIEIENSIVKRQEPVAMNRGTSIAMKNLFFNVPARRNFLKSNSSELKHIIDEFTRVALAFPEILFTLEANGQLVYQLEKGSLKQRILQALGNNYQSNLVNVNEQTDYFDITGFVGKPETAKKTRGDQYFFVNNRFIKSAYLNHAVMRAFENLIPKDSFPMYALYIQLDPTQVDINVHPTKQEIKFEDERVIYAFVESAVKHALAQFSITPTLDFELDASVENTQALNRPVTGGDAIPANNNLFRSFSQKNQASYIERNSELKHWRDFYGPANKQEPQTTEKNINKEVDEFIPLHALPVKGIEDVQMLQLHNSFIVLPNEDGYLLIHQQNAHERVLYERFQMAVEGKPISVQQSLFPATMQLSPADAIILEELLPELQKLGFMLMPAKDDSFEIQGIPADIPAGNEAKMLESVLEQYKHYSAELKFSNREKLLRTMAMQQALRSGKPLTGIEMQQLVKDLFSCKVFNTTPNGKPTYFSFNKQELDKMFGR